ncbi:MAG TPA: HEAT repeat domain-containing protein [Candidatus Syntrophoarchaeum butanivorans]|uniref:HEAT repeat domain-containing protein n=1 Tax=Candidatus Syntropharchaeum butanivorans TaxID=1839936 RepID=A0A1F2P6T5_9EURY|nr:MAG: PBS lyase HEAT domain-containing protein repeat-containing protein [Candidatus Syntrophoarchaeum butanivorans]RJS71798.1 MAG: HEAT repeat domain-containing protein [Candidatus Syntrophoarchaeum sp. WYZ-LMO15]HDM36458.1 HEAT repeat domain-containing protein [Candidatus Syntrophoarchaeum butanivorans]HEC56954.1 HEAT repeat domain-containing protein [Candidatus Syntrophoarchaeum butanivorans]
MERESGNLRREDEIADWEIQELIACLKSKDRFRRLNALFVIESSGDERFIEPLIALTKHEDRATREYALYLLATLENRVACGEKVVEAFIDALGDESPSIRRYASLMLGYFRDEAATKPLIMALRDEDEGVREEVMRTLSEILISMGPKKADSKI